MCVWQVKTVEQDEREVPKRQRMARDSFERDREKGGQGWEEDR